MRTTVRGVVNRIAVLAALSFTEPTNTRALGKKVGLSMRQTTRYLAELQRTGLAEVVSTPGGFKLGFRRTLEHLVNDPTWYPIEKGAEGLRIKKALLVENLLTSTAYLGIDRAAACVYEYLRLCVAAVKQAFPLAEVDVVIYSALEESPIPAQGTQAIWRDADQPHVADTVDEICQEVFDAGAWLAAAAGEDDAQARD